MLNLFASFFVFHIDFTIECIHFDSAKIFYSTKYCLSFEILMNWYFLQIFTRQVIILICSLKAHHFFKVNQIYY
jgi:hypothetical protein